MLTSDISIFEGFSNMSLTIHQVGVLVELMKFLLKQLVFEFQVLLSSTTSDNLS